MVAEPGVDLLELAAHLHPQLGIELAERLVEQEHLRPPTDGAPERHALPLPARELARIALEMVGKAEDARHLTHPLGNLGRDAWIPLDAFAAGVIVAGMRGARLRCDVFPGRPHQVGDVEIRMLDTMLTALSGGRDPLAA